MRIRKVSKQITGSFGFSFVRCMERKSIVIRTAVRGILLIKQSKSNKFIFFVCDIVRLIISSQAVHLKTLSNIMLNFNDNRFDCFFPQVVSPVTIKYSSIIIV